MAVDDEWAVEKIGGPDTLIGRFAQVARDHLADPALVGSSTFTYSDVLALAGRAATALRSDSDAAGAPLALLFEHDAPLVVAILAGMAAGRPVVVLDPRAPRELNLSVLADSGAPGILHDEVYEFEATELAQGGPRASSWMSLTDGSADRSSPIAPLAPISPDDIAMLAYTSGTTGSPKAAALPHRALLHVMDGAGSVLGITNRDTLPMLFPLSLAVAAYPAFLPLVHGGTLSVFDLRAEGLAPFSAWLAAQGVTVLYMSPTVARFMGETHPASDFPALRTVVLGGERVDAEAFAIVRDTFGSAVRLVNGYGTTETGVVAFHVIADGEQVSGAVPVGRPIDGMDIVIRAEDHFALDEGEIGELCVRSKYLFAGYWRQPEASRRVLTLDEDSGLSEYRTGDLARIRPDGELEILGRSDREVKVRGQRVTPGEVEQALLELEIVRDAVVDARPDQRGSSELVAWVVTDGAVEGDVRRALSATVKAHMVPARIVIVGAMPVLPNGKLDRVALGRLDVEAELPARQLPRDDLERELVDVWQQVLARTNVGIHEDFTELGGQSLDAAWMLVLLEEQHGLAIPMGDMLGIRTVAQLADRIRPQLARRTRRSSLTVVQAGSADRPTLYFVHDLHGSAYSLRFLGPALGVDQPLVGFESPFLSGQRAPFSRLETLALRYVTDLRRHQPEGPYHLAGYSFGGVLAFEIARQLVEAGSAVDFLGVFDVGPGYRGRHYHPRRAPKKPWLKVPMVPEGMSPAERAGWYLKLGRQSPVDLAYNLLVRSGLDHYTDPLEFAVDLRRHGVVRADRRLWYAWQRHWELAHDYKWEGLTYPGPMTLFWADESASTDSTMGWGDIVEGELDVVRVPIEHVLFMTEDGAAVLGGALRSALDRGLESPKRGA